MATLKHINSKNADYGAAEQYLLFEHDEFTMKPVLDETGRLIPREDYRLSTLNCDGEDFAVACMRANLRYQKNQRREDVKSHHYIISFDPRDGPDNGLTVDRAQALGEQFCKEHFPGHQALVCTRPDGTYCERERDALLRDTAQHLEWSTYGGASETLLAFAVKIDGMERGKVKGSLYQLDYAAHAGHLKEIALPRHHATLTFEDGAKRTCSLQDYPGHQNAIMARYGKIAAVRYEPADAGQLAALLRAEQEGRETLAPGRIGDHIRGLNAGRILDEARRIVADVQRLAAGETVKGAHDSRFFYSVPISRDFLALSTDEDLTRLYTVLPFVKHDICAPEHDGGRFVAIPRDENLNQKIRATAARSSPSVLHQLQQAKKEAAREAAKAATIKKGKGEMTL